MNTNRRYNFVCFLLSLIAGAVLVLNVWLWNADDKPRSAPAVTHSVPSYEVRAVVEAYYIENPPATVPNDYLALYDYVQRSMAQADYPGAVNFAGVAGEGATDAQVAEAMYSVRAQLSGEAYSAVALSYADARGAMHSQLCRLVAGSAPAQYVCSQS